MPSIACTDLTFTWPDGTRVLDGVDLALGPGHTGLVGVNGSGKSTLLRLVAGELRPTRGAVGVDGTVGYLPQHLTLRTDRPVDDVLGVHAVRAALRRVQDGRMQPDDLAIIGDDWDVDTRARATLDPLGLAHVGLDRVVGELSGGEAVLLELAALFLRRVDVLLLDEPTNNLDVDRRHRLYEAIDAHRGVAVVVSHDRTLLERMDRIADLRAGRVRVHRGDLTAYEEAVAHEQDAARRTVRAAEADLRRQRREQAAAQTVLDRRRRTGRKQAAERRVPKVVAQERKRQAQVSGGKLRDVHADRVAAAEADLTRAAAQLRDDDEVRIELPQTAVPSRRVVVECRAVNVAVGGRTAGLWHRDVELLVRGPQRLALTGPNGGGKTTLLRLVAGLAQASRGTATVGVDSVRYLPQRLDVLDDDADLLTNLRRRAPHASDEQLRDRLARFLFRGPTVTQPAGTLSGGERFRAVLATLLGAEPPPQLLLLDEPTNNLDLASTRQLVAALEAYRGALVVASHDLAFLRAVGVRRWMRLDRGHGLEETDASAVD